ncbi:class I SAM-dependent methyltransferase [Chryseolinea sp. T2]|uniref:class I SAM-dependent methyltransferase n=1 Tax=Chryseolinea sp. T2 TaxID=3129255 RepID=UPI0030788C48
MNCRFCSAPLSSKFAELVNSPLSNSFLTRDQLNEPETYFPLTIYACSNCHLVQVDEYKNAREIFNNDYVYFSSYSTSWVAHAKRYVESMITRFGYNKESLVVEIASNDGYLLQHFNNAGVPVLGVEPTTNTARVAIEKGIPTLTEYFTADFAKLLVSLGKGADLVLGNNVLAHVPNINDFVEGLKIVLKPTGVVTMEFPHLLKMVEQCQFDTIYHEHYSYLSFTTVQKVFAAHGLELFDVEEQPTHGGSLRIFAKHVNDTSKAVTSNVARMLKKEADAGMLTREYYKSFQAQVNAIKNQFLRFLIECQDNGGKVIGYGAAAKGNTLMNYAGLKGNDLIKFVVDAAPSKQGKFLPGSHIPVYNEQKIAEYRPDYVIIFPWNLKDEIMNQLAYIREWGGQFAVFVPKLQVYNPNMEKVA